MNCTNAIISKKTQDCGCLPNQYLQENINKQTKTCVSCSFNEIPFPFDSDIKTRCVSCPQGMEFDPLNNLNGCVCLKDYTKTIHECVSQTLLDPITSKYPPVASRIILYDQVDNSEGTSIFEKNKEERLAIENINSNLNSGKNTNNFALNSDSSENAKTITIISSMINYYYLDSAFNCLYYENIKSCQNLANLCVIQMYDESNPVCILYNTINNSKERPTVSYE
jgi:hypothetical protein